MTKFAAGQQRISFSVMATSAALLSHHLNMFDGHVVIVEQRDELFLSFFIRSLSRRIVTAVMCFMFSYFHNRSDGRHSSHRSLRSPYEDITDPIVCGLCTLYQSSLQIFSFFIYFFLVSPFNFSERPIRLFQLLEEKEVIIANAIQQFIIYISINIYLIFIELLHQ